MRKGEPKLLLNGNPLNGTSRRRTTSVDDSVQPWYSPATMPARRGSGARTTDSEATPVVSMRTRLERAGSVFGVNRGKEKADMKASSVKKHRSAGRWLDRLPAWHQRSSL